MTPETFTPPCGELLVAPEHAAWAERIFERLAAPDLSRTSKAALAAASQDDSFWNSAYAMIRPYRVRAGALIVPVHGMLLNNFPAAFGPIATGYEYIEAAVQRGLSDPEVREIVLHVDSYGGTVAGCFDCADMIYASRAVKPIRAVADENAYSAGYAIASAAESVTVSRSGGVGSIGVISAHVDISGALERDGYKVTLIYAGAQKADMHPAFPLSEAAEARAQERVNALYQIFVSSVARNRGLDEATVRGTEAATYMASQAIEIGLADAIGSLDTLSAIADPSPTEEETEMSKDNQAAPAAATTEPTAAALAAARAEGFEAGKAEGATAERERVRAILGSEEAKKRPIAARNLALKLPVSAEEALAFLAEQPEEPSAEAAAPKRPALFDQMMAGTADPNVEAEPDAVDDAPQMSVAERIFASAGHKSRT